MTQFIETKLGDITELISRGITPSYSNSGVIIINQKCIREGKVSLDQARLTDPIKKKIREDKFLRSFDILINSTGQGTLGRVSQFKEVTYPITVDSHVTIVRAKSEVDSVFLGYILKSKQPQIEALAEGSTGQTELSRNKLAEIDISLPPLPTQKAIAEILSSLDDKIELNNQINQNLEALAQALFKQWFVDFEFPNENGEPYKASVGEMIDSELGEIPKGWRIEPLEKISDILIGRTPPRNQEEWFSVNEQDVKWISIRDMGESGVFIFNTAERITEKAISKFRIPLIQAGTIILSFKLTVGRLAIATERMISNEAIAQIKITEPSQFPEFIYLYLKIFNFDSLGSTSSIATAVNSKSIKSIPVIQPKPEILRQFQVFISPIFENIRSAQIEIENLKKLRDTLLPKLISGELEVNESLLEPIF